MMQERELVWENRQDLIELSFYFVSLPDFFAVVSAAVNDGVVTLLSLNGA